MNVSSSSLDSSSNNSSSNSNILKYSNKESDSSNSSSSSLLKSQKIRKRKQIRKAINKRHYKNRAYIQKSVELLPKKPAIADVHESVVVDSSEVFLQINTNYPSLILDPSNDCENDLGIYVIDINLFEIFRIIKMSL